VHDTAGKTINMMGGTPGERPDQFTFLHSVRASPGCLSGLSVLQSESSFDVDFVWVGRALNGPFRPRKLATDSRGTLYAAEARLGFGRFLASHYRSYAPYQIY
jgi:hypothetical protein